VNSHRVLFVVLPLLVALPSMRREPQQNLGGQSLPASAKEMGPFVVSFSMEPAEKEKIISQVRGFLWDHLQNHTPGQLQITFGNLEGDPTEHTILVRLDKKGNTVILDHIATIEAALLKPGEKPRHRAFLDRFCAFERIDKDTQKTIPDDETRPVESFKLRLKNCKTGAAPTFPALTF
jgi:hypothetical protein